VAYGHQMAIDFAKKDKYSPFCHRVWGQSARDSQGRTGKCQHNRVKGPKLSLGKSLQNRQNYAKIGQKSLTHVQEGNAPSSSAKLAPPILLQTQSTSRVFQRNGETVPVTMNWTYCAAMSPFSSCNMLTRHACTLKTAWPPNGQLLPKKEMICADSQILPESCGNSHAWLRVLHNPSPLWPTGGQEK
jgi:hypothetical protein